MLGKNKVSTEYLPEVLVKMRVGGNSNKNISNIIKKSYEDYNALRMNNISFPSFTLLLKNITKLPQLFVK
jgi:glycosyltransferase